MGAERFVFLGTIAFLLMSAAQAKAAAPALTVAHIIRGGDSVSSAAVTLRSLDRKTVLASQIQVNKAFPEDRYHDVYVEVPSDLTVVLASGKSTATLEPGSRETFAWTGKVESVAIEHGAAKFT